MSDQPKSVSGPTGRWRRYLRFSLRGLIVVVLLIGGWLGWIVRSARIQRDAVAAIERAGGLVTYNSVRNAKPRSRSRKPVAANWLMNAIGIDFFDDVVEVRFPFPAKCTDDELAHVGRLPALISLTIVDTKLTDAAVANLRALAKLSHLSLPNCHITDAALSNLEGMTDLSQLNLRESRLTDAGLVYLKTLNKLNHLDLGSSQISDSGLARLKGLTNISSLNLGGTQVTDAGLSNLKGMTKLTILYLYNTRVTEEGRGRLRRVLPKINTLR